jgi:hypothetical protein
MKIHTVPIILLLLLVFNVQALVINEVMPDPEDNCRDCSEWIEIASYVNASLENITVDTGENPITLNGSIKAGEFIMITKNSSAFSKIWGSDVRIFENRGMSLHNDGDNITIYNGSEVLHRIEYTGSENNKSYGLCNLTFVLQNASTPGFPNMCPSEGTNETNETNTTNQTCDLSLSITSDLILISGEKHGYYLAVEDKNCDQAEKKVSIEYWIEDLFGEMIKSEYTTMQSMICSKNISRQWTPKDVDGSEAFYIIANITNSTCNDSDHSNDFAEKLIVVKGEKHDSDPCPPCETKETACSCGPCPVCTSEEEKEGKQEDFEIISYPEEIRKDEEIEIKIEIRNPVSQSRNYTVYSYAYEGNKPVSLGFDGKEWLNTWDANKKNVSVLGNSSVVIELNNRIAEDTNPGEYTLRVRIWFEGGKHDLTEEIMIKEPLPVPGNQTIEEENETEHNKSEAGLRIPTGEIIHKGEGNWFSNFIENLINFFKSVFRI